MNERYISYTELVNYLLENELADDFTKNVSIGIGSISEFLYLIEDSKKNNFKRILLWSEFDKFIDLVKSEGKISIANLSKEQLEECLFEEVSNDIILWDKAVNSTLNPKESISLLSIKPTKYTWWDVSILNDLIKYHNIK